MKELDIFNELIKDSLPKSRYKIEEVSDSRYYYEEKYGDLIIQCYKRLGLTSKDFGYVETKYCGKRRKICSIDSTGRLSFLYLFKDFLNNSVCNMFMSTDSGVPLEEDTIRDANIDAKNGNTYYKCICQEIFDCDNSLSKTSISILKEYFGLENLVASKDIIATELSNLLGLDRDCYKLRIDINQLFKQLDALIKLNKEKQDHLIIKYIFFKPKEELIKGTVLEQVFQELEEERVAIKNSHILKIALEKYNISFEYEDICVGDDIFSKDPRELLEYIKTATSN